MLASTGLATPFCKYKMGKLNVQRLETTDLFQYSIFFLCTDQLRREMESAGKDEGEKKTEAGEINIALRASWKIETEKRSKQ